MIPIKTNQEIKIMTEGGHLLTKAFGEVLEAIKPGVKFEELEKLAVLLIKKTGGKPSFKMVDDYHWATCLNLNTGVVHGIPEGKVVKKGDLVSLDMGLFFKGFHTDMAETIEVETEKHHFFLKTGQKALKEAIRVARPGNRVGDISKAIKKELKKGHFYPVLTLTGHGIGRNLHQPPAIPCFLKGKLNQTAVLRAGMTLAIEVIYTQNETDLSLDEDNWTLKTADGSLSGLFEKTIALRKEENLVLTA